MSFTQVRRSSGIRFGTLVVVYTFVLTGCHWLAYELRFDFEVPAEQQKLLEIHWSWVVPLKLLILGFCGQFAGLLSYFSIPDLRRIFYASSVSSLMLLLIRYYFPEFYPTPRGVILLDFFFSSAGLIAVRLGLRLFRERYLAPQSRPTRHQARRVAIIGAGDVGANLARELLSKRGLGMHPVAFFDDDPTKWRSRMHDIPVIGAPEALLDQKLNLELEEVIIAMPSAPAKRIGEVVKLLQRARLRFETVPSIDQLATGQVRASQLRSVEIQDLLGRPPVALETESIRSILQSRIVMVTGAGGSIGSELCRQIASFNPQRLLLVEQSEVQLFQIEQELIELGHGGVVLPLVADVLDSLRMELIFRRFCPAVIFHAAAHKHVPMMENQPSEAIKNNTLGTIHLAQLSLKFRVERFVLISTDKAISPTSVMGATKRMAEIFLQSLHANINALEASGKDAFHHVADIHEKTLTVGQHGSEPDSIIQESGKDGLVSQAPQSDSQERTFASREAVHPVPSISYPPEHFQSSSSSRGDEAVPLKSELHQSIDPAIRTKFMAVRFGNVLGSSGSVIPIFNKQIAAGGPVKVTHPEVTRYFMTIPEAVGLVLQSAAQGEGGEIFVLDMGKPVKIVDLARQLIELSGLKPDEDIEIVFTGLRPGEKLFEELSHKAENATPTNHPKIMRFVSQPLPLKEVRQQLERLTSQLHEAEPNQLKLLIKEIVPEYTPYLT